MRARVHLHWAEPRLHARLVGEAAGRQMEQRPAVGGERGLQQRRLPRREQRCGGAAQHTLGRVGQVPPHHHGAVGAHQQQGVLCVGVQRRGCRAGAHRGQRAPAGGREDVQRAVGARGGSEACVARKEDGGRGEGGRPDRLGAARAREGAAAGARTGRGVGRGLEQQHAALVPGELVPELGARLRLALEQLGRQRAVRHRRGGKQQQSAAAAHHGRRRAAFLGRVGARACTRAPSVAVGRAALL